MELNLKRKVRAFTAVIALVIVAALATLPFALRANAEDKPCNEGETYFYEELGNSKLARKFYDIFLGDAKAGKYLGGNYEHDITNELTQSQLSQYVSGGSPEIPVAFSAARDAFYMDNPDLFYLDVYKLYLTAGTDASGKYVAYVGTGNADSYFYENTVTAANVNKAIEDYEKAVNAIVTEARKKDTVVDKIKYVNAELCKVEYDYEVRNDADKGIIKDGYVHTANGALVNKIAVCDGFSRAFKAVMDRLDIPCVVIGGSMYSGEAPDGREAGLRDHAWNAVKVDGVWYGVDVTNNAGTTTPEKYLLVGSDFMAGSHYPDGVISSSGFELKYPVLRALGYGVNQDRYGFNIIDSGKLGNHNLGYEKYSSDNTDATYLYLGAGYNGLDAVQLKKEGKYLAYRAMTEGSDDWQLYIGIEEFAANTSVEFPSVNGYTLVEIDPGMASIQFLIIDYAPDFGGDFPYLYTSVEESHILATSVIYGNDAAGTKKTAPFVIKRNPDEYGTIKSMDPIDIELTYDEKLVMSDGSAITDPSKIDIVVHDRNGKIVSGEAKLVKVQNVTWNAATNTLGLKFTPNGAYAHNGDMYSFTPVNLIGEKTGKTPAPGGYYAFEREKIICPKVFNDGRLYMKVYGHPQLVDTQDLTLDDKFVDSKGNPIIKQRSQMLLVVDEPANADSLESALKAEHSEIKSSATYEINLQMCGLIQKVPDGSYMQLGFGFPEGYAPDDNKNVTYTVYHYRLDDDGKVIGIDKVPCVINEYGIVATVNSFSPFSICAVDKSAVTTRNIYASVIGEGGSIDKTKVIEVSEGGSVEYAVTIDNDYVLDSVLLNGKDKVEVANGKITLAYSELAENNTLEIKFVSKRINEFRTQNNITVVSPRYVVKDSDMIQAVAHSESASSPAPKKNKAALIAIIVVVIVLVLAGCGVFVWFLLKKKNDNNGGNGGKGGNTKKKPAKTTTDKTTASKTSGRTTTPSNNRTAAPRPNSGTRPAPRSGATRPTTAK